MINILNSKKKQELFIFSLLVLCVVGISYIPDVKAITFTIFPGHSFTEVFPQGILYTQEFTGLPPNYNIGTFGIKIAAHNTMTYNATEVRFKFYKDDNGTGFPSTLIYQTSSLPITGNFIQNFTVNFVTPLDGNVWAAMEFNGDIYMYSMGLGPGNTYGTVRSYGSGPSPMPNNLFDTDPYPTSTSTSMYMTTSSEPTIDPAIPTFGPIGTSVFLNLNNFEINGTANIDFGGQLIANSTVILNSTGGWKGTVLVPSGAANNINVNDGFTVKSTAYTITTPGSSFPYVTSLYATSITNSSVSLAWNTPTLSNFTLSGYQINYTTPNGIPLSVLVNNTNNAATFYTVSSLTPGTQYSFRIGTITTSGSFVNGSNILDLQTLTRNGPCLLAGCLDLNVGTNPLRIPYDFKQADINTTHSNLFVLYPNTYNTTCNFNYLYENINQNYSNLSTTPNETGRVSAEFQLYGIGGDVINVRCHDEITKTYGAYVISPHTDEIPIVKQIHDFQEGKFGTAGQFGAFDFILLVIIIISMLGLNRVNETVGAIIMIIVIGGLAYFHIGSLIVAIIGALAMAVLLTVSTTKKLAFSP